MKILSFLSLFVDAFKEWQEDRAPRLAAALAYYTIFSLAPMLIILVAIAGRFLGPEAARGAIITRTQNLVGLEVARVIQTIIQNASQPDTTRIATIISVATILWGASNLFNQIYEALNTIWDISSSGKRSILVLVKARFQAFAIVIVAGLLLIFYLALSTTLSSLIPIIVTLIEENLLTDLVDIEQFLPVFRIVQIAEFVVTFGVITFLLALIYKVLPDAAVAWRDVWVGAAFTSLLFGLGKLLIGIYMGLTTVGSAYGAAGSLLIILLWVYLSSQLFLYGAEFTHVYANRFGSMIRPAGYLNEEEESEAETEDGPAAEAAEATESPQEQAGQPVGNGR